MSHATTTASSPSRLASSLDQRDTRRKGEERLTTRSATPGPSCGQHEAARGEEREMTEGFAGNIMVDRSPDLPIDWRRVPDGTRAPSSSLQSLSSGLGSLARSGGELRQNREHGSSSGLRRACSRGSSDPSLCLTWTRRTSSLLSPATKPCKVRPSSFTCSFLSRVCDLPPAIRSPSPFRSAPLAPLLSCVAERLPRFQA